MSISIQLSLWLLRKHRSVFVKLKKLQGLAVAGDDQFLDLHAELLKDGRGTQTFRERYNLYALAKSTSRLPGALAEVGVYRGGSAKIICRVKGDAPLYLFDTFEGMPTVNKSTDGAFSAGDFADTGYEDVVAYLAAFPNLHFYKGFFPDSAVGKEPEQQQFRFVHLDLDIFESTLQALAFFYPRMVRGGVILSHDYNQCYAPGVKKAFHEFFADKPETIIPMWDTQCAVVKM